MLKKKLIAQGFKNKDIDIANELLGEKFGDTSTSRSLYGELMNQEMGKSNNLSNINASQYSYALEIHFNACDTCGGTAKGITTLCNKNDKCFPEMESINREIRNSVVDVLGTTDRGDSIMDMVLKSISYFKENGVPFTYLETEFFDN